MKALGFDPGKSAAWTALELARPGAQARVIGVGILDRGVGEGRDERVAEAIDLFFRFQPDLVVVETVEFVVGREGFGPNMAGHLLRAARLGGRIYQAAIDHGFAAEEITAETWRNWLVGSPQAKNPAIKSTVRIRVLGWPARTTNHEDDSAGVTYFGADRALRSAS